MYNVTKAVTVSIFVEFGSSWIQVLLKPEMRSICFCSFFYNSAISIWSNVPKFLIIISGVEGLSSAAFIHGSRHLTGYQISGKPCDLLEIQLKARVVPLSTRSSNQYRQHSLGQNSFNQRGVSIFRWNGSLRWLQRVKFAQLWW